MELGWRLDVFFFTVRYILSDLPSCMTSTGAGVREIWVGRLEEIPCQYCGISSLESDGDYIRLLPSNEGACTASDEL